MSKIEELRAIAKKKGLRTTGTESELLERLKRREEIEEAMNKYSMIKDSEEPEEDQMELVEEFDEIEEPPGRWVVVHCTGETYAVGVYRTLENARAAYIEYLINEKPDDLEAGLKSIKEEYPEISYRLVFEEWEDLRDYAIEYARIIYEDNIHRGLFEDEVPHDISNLPDGEEFDFRIFREWDEDNLYELQEKLREGVFDDDPKDEVLVFEDRLEVEDNTEKRDMTKKNVLSSSLDELIKQDPQLEELARLVESENPPGDSGKYPARTKLELDEELDMFSSRLTMVKLPDQVYDNGMVVIELMERMRMSTKGVNYDTKKISINLGKLIELDAEKHTKHKDYIGGRVVEFKYVSTYPYGPAWFVKAWPN